ncbi:MAG: 4Fe-4S dicluster domain-containing protein [Hyphomicrobiaceae bacterium]
MIDTSICTGCRACQTACKQWNENPAQKTSQTGTYQNPPDLNFDTYKLVRFAEEKLEGEGPKQFFFTDQCRHCVFPLCKVAADEHAPGAVEIDPKTRAVIFNPEVKVSAKAFEEIRAICPFDIPRYSSEAEKISKCTMCNDRVHNGMQPACVKACPTGSMSFGLREEILDRAKDRLAKRRKSNKRATLIDPGSVRAIYLVDDHPDKYHEHASARSLIGLTRRAGLGGVFRMLATFLGFYRAGST